jgi:hypothetical protein
MLLPFVLRPLGEAFLDRILVRTTESRENQLAAIGMPIRHRHVGALLVHRAQLTQLSQLQPGIDAVHIEVQRDDDDVQVSRALAVAKERALHAIRAGQQPHFRGRHAGPAVVVRMQRDDERFPVADVPANPLDLIRVYIRHRHLHGIRQIQDHLSLRRGLPYVHHGLRDVLGKFHLRRAKALGRVLQHHLRSAQSVNPFLDPLRTADGHLDDLVFRFAKDHAPLRGRGAVVQMNHAPSRSDQRGHGPLDQVFACLHQHLHGDVIRDVPFLDQPAVERKFGIRSRRKTDFDFLEPAADQRLKHLELLLDVHWFLQRLVAVAEIHGAPHGRSRQDAAGPLPVGQMHRRKGPVFRRRLREHGSDSV